jgi:hypothetical protein
MTRQQWIWMLMPTAEVEVPADLMRRLLENPDILAYVGELGGCSRGT